MGNLLLALFQQVGRIDPETMAAQYAFHAACSERGVWSLDTSRWREFATTPFRPDGISDIHDADQIDGGTSQLALLSQLDTIPGLLYDAWAV